MKKRKKTIGIYVMITLMLVAGIPIIVMLTSSYLTTKNLLIERNDLNKESAVNLILAEEKSLRRSTESKLKSMAELPAMKTEFSMGRIRSDLSLAIAGSNSFLAVTFGTEDDEYVTFNPLPDDYKPTIRPWYKGAVKAEGEVYWTAPYLDTVSNQFVTSASIRVKNSHNQVGVLSVDVSYESIQNILSSFTVGRTGNVTLVSESGVIVTSKNTKQIGKNIKEEEVFQKIKEAKNPTGMVGLGDSNKVNDVLYDKSADSNVWAYSEVKASDLDKELGALVRTTIIVTILMLLFVGLVSYAAIKVVAAIIDCFNRYFRKVGEGKLEKMSKTKRVKGERWTWDQLARRGVYPDKAAKALTNFKPESLGKEVMAPLTKGGKRAVNQVLLVVNTNDYWAKVFPATTVMTQNGTYAYGVLPIPAKIVQSVAVPEGKMVAGVASDYFMGMGATRKIESSKEVRFIEDETVYLAKLYANGRPKDNDSFLVFDINGVGAPTP